MKTDDQRLPDFADIDFDFQPGFFRPAPPPKVLPASAWERARFKRQLFTECFTPPTQFDRAFVTHFGGPTR